MTRDMIVYRPDGSIYFRTPAASLWSAWSPERRESEADFWRDQGYRVEFEETPLVEPL